MSDEGAALRGCGVLVTRPAQQAEGLSRRLERDGARVLRFPLVCIGPAPDPNAAQAGLAALEGVDMAIFVSANAARFAVTVLPDLPSRLGSARIACVGAATAAALERLGIHAELVPPDATTSEALLGLPALDQPAISGRRVAIIKGEGGRPLLADTLVDRGALVEVIDVYRREPPREDLGAFLDRNAPAIQLGVVTSAESLQRLAELAGLDRVREMPLVLPSKRVLDRALDLGFHGPFEVAQRMSDEELAAAAARLACSITRSARGPATQP